MNRQLAMKVADAVLYEGYMLYPYRHSSLKNRQRWTFGILYPPAFSEVETGTERCTMHSECLVNVSGEALIEIQLRFLHLKQINRQSGQSRESWDEAVERSVELKVSCLENRHATSFSFNGSFEAESSASNAGQAERVISRTQHEITGTISVLPEKIRDNFLKLAIEVTNTTGLSADALDRDAALLRSLLSAHTILTVTGGEFVSLLDPPELLRAAVAGCRNQGNFPVLVGNRESGERDMVLCSPIILYDYPQIAPESNGDFYDATEMDEMLTLRIMTLTEKEKDEMRSADEHGRELLERTEQSGREQLMRTHGAIRSLRPLGGK